MTEPITTDTIDLQRVPFEIKGAIEATGVLLEQIEPGLEMTVDLATDEMVIYENTGGPGVALCRVPMGRLRMPDPVLLRKAAVTTLEQIAASGGIAEADQLAQAINDDEIDLIMPPDADMVYVHVLKKPLFATHRRVVVESWVERDR